MTVQRQISDGLDESIAFYSGKGGVSRAFKVQRVDGNFIKKLRGELKLTQREFAIKFGISLPTLQKWEANYRVPEGPAQAYLQVIAEIPEAISEAYENASKRSVRESKMKK